MKVIRCLVPPLLFLGSAFAQAPAPRQEFEVISVKPTILVPGANSIKLGFHIDGAQVHLSYSSIGDVIRMAYKLKNYQIIGSDLESQRYDVDAKLPAGSSKEQVPDMLQSLLADRFHLKFHNETRELPVYALGVAPGAKLKDLADNSEEVDAKAPVEVTAFGGPGGVGANLPGGGSYAFGDNKFSGKKLTMVYLADILSRFMDRPVVDMTGLKGKYDVTVQLTDDDYRAMLIRAAVAAGVSLPPEAMRLLQGATDSSLYAGLHANGLKLEARKAPLPVLVVDSVLKTPTGN
jgi:uncharacterized protein (TIGR03435 family)